MHPTNRFDPAEWRRVYDKPEGLVFQRGSALVETICRGNLRPGERWLDVGSGTGHLLRALDGSGAFLIGCDHDLAMVRYSREESGRSAFVAGDAERLPFCDGCLDGVAAVSTMGCLVSAGPFFSEAHRVLRAGGLLVATFTNRDSWLRRANNLAGRRRGGGVYSLYSGVEVTRDLRDVGFEIVGVRFYNFVLSGEWVEGFGRYGVSRWLGRNFVAVGRKSGG